MKKRKISLDAVHYLCYNESSLKKGDLLQCRIRN